MPSKVRRRPLCRFPLALLDLLLRWCQCLSPLLLCDETYKCLHGAVQRMSVVPSELGVGTLERWVTEGLRLLDTVGDCQRCSSKAFALSFEAN